MTSEKDTHKRGLSNVIPVFPLSGAVLLPGIEVPLSISGKANINMVNDALSSNRLMGLIQPEQKKFSRLLRSKPLFRVGCAGKIKAFNEFEDGSYLIVLSGISRFETVEEIATTRGYRKFQVSYDKFPHDIDSDKLAESFKPALSRKELVKKVDDFLKGSDNVSGFSELKPLESVEPAFLIDFLCSYLPFSAEEKQLLIESKTIEERAETLYKVLGLKEAGVRLIETSDTIH